MSTSIRGGSNPRPCVPQHILPKIFAPHLTQNLISIKNITDCSVQLHTSQPVNTKQYSPIRLSHWEYEPSVLKQFQRPAGNRVHHMHDGRFQDLLLIHLIETPSRHKTGRGSEWYKIKSS